MGAWSVSITGNDTAQDLRDEYTAAFFRYGVDEAVKKIDDYVRKTMFDETDEEEWCNYIYSLADFMWKKGILTEEMKNTALGMVDSGFGLELWEESGKSVLNSRKKALEKFRAQIISPMPPKKKIKPNVNTTPIFEDGDVIAIKLMTAGKKYAKNDEKAMTNEEFHALDGKYILLQKIENHASWTSFIVPDVKDYWAIFRLFDGVYDDVPKNVDIKSLKDANIHHTQSISPLFCCESSMFYFKKRKYQVLFNDKSALNSFGKVKYGHIFFGVDHDCENPDSIFLSAMGREVETGDFDGSVPFLKELCCNSLKYGTYNYRLTEAENQARWQEITDRTCEKIDKEIANGSNFYGVRFGNIVGVISANGKKLDNFHVIGRFRRNGFGTALLKYAANQVGEGAYIDIPENDKILLHICEKADFRQTTGADNGFIRMSK